MSESLPGTSGTVAAIKAASDLIEVELSLFLAAIEDALEVHLIPFVLREFPCALDGERGHVENAGTGVGVETIKRAFAVATGGDEASFSQQAQVGADPGLAEAGDLLKFVDGQFFVFEQGDDAKSGRVGQSS